MARVSLLRISDSISLMMSFVQGFIGAEAPGMVFTTLAHQIDASFLREAYRLTRKDGAPGIDGQTAETYEENLEENLTSLLNRFKTGTYRAPAVRRVHIPKGTGTETRVCPENS